MSYKIPDTVWNFCILMALGYFMIPSPMTFFLSYFMKYCLFSSTAPCCALKGIDQESDFFLWFIENSHGQNLTP